MIFASQFMEKMKNLTLSSQNFLRSAVASENTGLLRCELFFYFIVYNFIIVL